MNTCCCFYVAMGCRWVNLFSVLAFGFTRPSQDLGSVLVNGHKPRFISIWYATGSLNCALVCNSLLASDLD